jgi:PKD repeat protein
MKKLLGTVCLLAGMLFLSQCAKNPVAPGLESSTTPDLVSTQDCFKITHQVKKNIKAKIKRLTPLNVDISVTPLAGISPMLLTCTSIVSNGKTPIVYFWNFGDGTTSTEQNPVHTYSNVGTFTLTINIHDSKHFKPRVFSTNVIIQVVDPNDQHAIEQLHISWETHEEKL